MKVLEINRKERVDDSSPSLPAGAVSGDTELAKAPDWFMLPHFVRNHAKYQYQFLKAITEDHPAVPDFRDRLRVQGAMAAVIRSNEQGGWVKVAGL